MKPLYAYSAIWLITFKSTMTDAGAHRGSNSMNQKINVFPFVGMGCGSETKNVMIKILKIRMAVALCALSRINFAVRKDVCAVKLCLYCINVLTKIA